MTTVVSYGAGTNSTAMLIGLWERGERPDAILFADTGAEKPHTYEHLRIVNEWCKSVGFPEITVVASKITLEQDCITRKALPSVAYGFKTCSQRWKKQPQDKWMNNNGMKDAVKLIGIDADELRRAKEYPNTRYPLIEWDWGREECVEAIERAGLPQPGKSACYFCPSSRPKEILELAKMYPDLAERAVIIEHNAELTSVKGLGRSFAWGDLIKFNKAQLSLIPDYAPETPCGCYDG